MSGVTDVNPYKIVTEWLDDYVQLVESFCEEARRDGDEAFLMQADDTLNLLDRTRDSVRQWARETGAAWDEAMEGPRSQEREQRDWAREHDIKYGERIDGTYLTVRGGKLTVVTRETGSARESKLDLWQHICRYAALHYADKDAEQRKARARWRTTGASCPSGRRATMSLTHGGCPTSGW